MENEELPQIYMFAKSVKDFRTGNHTLYSSTSIVFMALIGILCGAGSWEEIELVCRNKKDLLKEYLSDEFTGIPSHDCFRYFFLLIDVKNLEDTFRSFMNKIKRPERPVIAVDGKTEKGASSVGKSTGKESKLHVISAFVTELGISIGQVSVGEKKNEIVEIPVLLDELDIKGSIITVDALGCQKNIAKKVIEKKADYIFKVKKNQELLQESIKEGCQKQIGKRTSCYEFASESSTGHSREEERTCFMCNFISWLPKCGHEWPGIKTFGCVTTTVKNLTTNRVTTERQYFISSLELNARLALDSIRKHWRIENNLHWQLDVSFREDFIRMDKNAMLNLSVMNKLVLPFLKLYPAKMSIRRKMMSAAMNDTFLKQVVEGAFDFYS